MGGEGTKHDRKVRFHGRVQFKTIRHVAEFAEEEIIAGWYRKKDFMRMSDEVSEIAQMVADGIDSHNGEDICVRGLEHLVEEDVADYRAEKMIASIDAVLDEQDEQREAEADDPTVIANIYGELASPLLREAYLVGLKDAKEAAAAMAEIPDLKPPKKVRSSKPKTKKPKRKLKEKRRSAEKREIVEKIESEPILEPEPEQAQSCRQSVQVTSPSSLSSPANKSAKVWDTRSFAVGDCNLSTAPCNSLWLNVTELSSLH